MTQPCGRHVDPNHGPSRDLGAGWKVRPCVGIKPGETLVPADTPPISMPSSAASTRCPTRESARFSTAFWYQAEPHAAFPSLPDRDGLEIV
jgi:hypothetical protein